MGKIILVIGYCVVLFLSLFWLDAKYEEKLPTIAWIVLFLIPLILGSLSKKLKHYLVHPYLFFGVILMLLVVIFDSLHEWLVRLPELF